MSRRGRGGGATRPRGQGRGKVSEDFNGFMEDMSHHANEDHGQNRHEPPALSGFFNFTSQPLPRIPQIPERISNNNSVSRVIRDTQEWSNGQESDDNKDYVHHYRQQAESRAAAKASKVQIRNETSRGRGHSLNNFEQSVVGTVPGSVCPGDDPEVFWKFDMKKRPVETSHLMINSFKEKILSALHSRQVVIVEGFTGCGKTTQVPQFILDEAAESKSRCRIVVTQPRRIAAISVANRVCQERGWQLGSLVGYQVGMDRKITDDTRLVYVTTGVLLQLLIAKRNLNEYTHIIIDEVHERDLETDLLLLVIKKLMMDCVDADTKVVLMSATLNAEKFRSYFPQWGHAELDSCAIVKVTVPALHKITEHYLDSLAAEYGFEGFTMDGSEEPRVFQECYDIATKIIEWLDFFEFSDEKFAGISTAEQREKFFESEKKSYKTRLERGAVLVFLPGLLEIDTLFKQLMELSIAKAGNSDRPDLMRWTVLPLHSSITGEEQQKVFLPARPGYRKIILATNIAESSITVPDIKYVIDFCLTKSLSCDPATNYTCLRMEWASKNQCIQRRGRCGRVAAGHVFRMVSKKFYEMMQQEALPEMEKASLEAVVLHVKVLNMGSPIEILALAVDPPKQSGIGRAVANLKEVGALTLNVEGQYKKYDGDLTYMGRVMSRLPIDIRFGRLIMLGLAFGVLDDAIVIAAGLSTKSPFSYPYAKRLEAYLSKLGWAVRTYSDCFAILNAFTAWAERHRSHDFRSFGEEKNWARTYFLQLSVMREMSSLVDEIKKRLKTLGIIADSIKLSNIERGFILKIVIAGAFYPNYFVRSRPNKKEYEREIVREVGGFNPLYSVVFQGFPIEQPGKLYAKHITSILTNHQSIPHLEFHASKVIVCFDPRGDKIGPISHGVYRAIKMRLLRQKVTFYTHGREDAVKALNRAIQGLELNPILPAPTHLHLPGIRESEFQCFVSHVDSPSEFWVIRTDEDDQLAAVNEVLNNPAENIVPLNISNLQTGCLCIIFRDSIRFRARIECVRTHEEALVYLLDNGISLWRPIKQIYALNESMLQCGLHKKAPLAIQCRLSEIKAATRNGCVWYHEVSQSFSDFIAEANNNFTMKVFSVVDSIVAGELHSPILKETANERMLKQLYADKTVEPKPSMENNDARRLWKVLNYDEHVIKAFDQKQLSTWQPERIVEPPKLNADNGCLVALRGPTSPLEMSFTSLCRSAHLKQVQIEGNSVNCVALDQDPFNPCSRLVIASNVGIAHRSGNIMARETTMMPAIPGLAALLTLVFCPKLELRIDEQGTRYTGCISGLGVDPSTGFPVYPDHDMELIFDTAIDNDDLYLSNSIRMTMNALMREHGSQHESAINLRERARNDIINLLQKHRESVDEVWPEVTHMWDVAKNVEILPPGGENCSTDTDVFPLHNGLILNTAELLEPVVPRNVFQPPPPF